MKLRRWQAKALTSALAKFRAGFSHFLCLATPGAGKTHMASVAAKTLIETNEIDLVFCFAPSLTVAESFRQSLEGQIQVVLDGKLGSKGQVMTYQAMTNLGSEFWTLFSRFRVFVIFDEIHHCAGDSLLTANSWGQHIIRHIQGKARYTMALTGTPWRSDKIPIALASYCQSGQVQCDYSYGLAQAIHDGVCRIPKINAIDNDRIVVQKKSGAITYPSISKLLESSDCTYQQLIDNRELITYLLNISNKKLDRLRSKDKGAAGLIVAASVDHAVVIADILKKQFEEQAYIATYLHDDSHAIIRHFRTSMDKWIISVGMISEGTDIPRLRVCCHLTRVKTELYFRQVLGRILRSGNNPNEEGYLFMPADTALLEFAHRIAEDVPSSNIVEYTSMGDNSDLPSSSTTDESEALLISSNELPENPGESVEDLIFGSSEDSPMPEPPNILSDAYDSTLGLFGRFRKQLIQLKQNHSLHTNTLNFPE